MPVHRILYSANRPPRAALTTDVHESCCSYEDASMSRAWSSSSCVTGKLVVPAPREGVVEDRVIYSSGELMV